MISYVLPTASTEQEQQPGSHLQSQVWGEAVVEGGWAPPTGRVGGCVNVEGCGTGQGHFMCYDNWDLLGSTP